MYKILLCDDEGIVREGIKFLIQKEFGDTFIIEEAKSGRIAIEKASKFLPDIVFMDIQMAGINGIEAMREIKKIHRNVVFIVLTAYDRFTYAKESIDVGVLDYLTKPINRNTVVRILNKAVSQIDEYRAKVSYDLKIREKMETIVPIIESGFVFNIFMQDYDLHDLMQYKELLGISEEGGYMLLIKYGDDTREGAFTNPVGAGIKVQKHVEELHEILKEFWPACASAIMGNRAVLFIPHDGNMSYEERVSCIERAHAMVRKLEQKMEMRFCVGIGSAVPLENLSGSYQEAAKAVKESGGKVTHFLDIPARTEYEEGYPAEVEEKMFAMLNKGNIAEVCAQCVLFIDWLQTVRPRPDYVRRLKVIELVLRAEHEVYRSGGQAYHLNDRAGYLEAVLACESYEELKQWFIEKMCEAARNIVDKQQECSQSVIKQAVQYIEDNFNKDISLDEVSQIVNISPYYFSKIFKEAEGINFVEYLTRLRISYAQKLLKKGEYSIKEICIMSGYSDPNYFSRIFKKCTNETPSEYREGKRYEKTRL